MVGIKNGCVGYYSHNNEGSRGISFMFLEEALVLMEFLVIIFFVEFLMNIVGGAMSFIIFYRIFHLQYQKLYILGGSLVVFHAAVMFLMFIGFLMFSFSTDKNLGGYLAYSFIHILVALVVCGIIDVIVLTQVPFFHAEHINYSLREPLVMGGMNVIVLLGNVLLFYTLVKNIAGNIVFL